VKELAGKTVFLTGGSSGIGLSTARMLAAGGASVVIFARDKDKLNAALAEIESRRISAAQRFACRPLDVTDHAAVTTALAAAVESFGAPDILINNVGRAVPRAFEDVTFAQFDETMKTNLYGAWSAVSALLPHMKAKGGAIVNVSSMAGFIGVFGYADYCASKFAVVGFSEALRQELRCFGISVSVLCPPDTDTPGLAGEDLTKPAETKAVSAGAKLLQPDDVARALLKGIRRGTFMIVPGREGQLAYFMKRYAPAVVDMVMRRGIRRAQQGTATVAAGTAAAGTAGAVTPRGER
jgi:NAD(P)-dependent dehydrogenase (short-subunit alcohol dehydrogenase family)